MCGIAGCIIQKEDRIYANTLKIMLRQLNHRGPDLKKEFHFSPLIHLGYTRFAINDANNGDQPFLSEDKSIACFYNGEIYNWKTLKEWLIRRGHNYKSECDGEVIPHIYEEYSLDFINKLEGMFAIALIDFKNGKIILIRDRIGEKPLFYSLNSNHFLFASTLSPLLTSSLVDKEIDKQSLAEFFTFRYVPYPNTILKSVKRLEPGSILIFDYQNWKLSRKIYWSPEIIQPPIVSEEKAMEELGKLLFNSVKLRTDTDKNLKVGTSLSGGIDSSTITSLAKSFIRKRDIHTFSVHVKDDPEDLTAIEKVVRKVKTKHQWINCNTEDINLLPQIVSSMGEPISAGMIIPSYQCYQEARNNNTRVLFSGDASDELFAGYSGRLIVDGIIRKWNTLDAHQQRNYQKAIPKLSEKIKSKSKLFNPSLSTLERYVIWDDDNCFDLDVREKILQGTSLAKYDFLLRIRELEKLTSSASYENSMLFLELKLRLVGFMLVILDRTSMSCPVECRSPYLDSKIVDLAFRLAPELKFSQGIEKYILRKVMEKTQLLPEEILWRRKHPFSGPISTWIDKLPRELEYLFSARILDHYGFVNSKVVSQMYREYKTGHLNRKTRIKYSDLLFAVLVITLWLEIFVENHSPYNFTP